MPSTRIKRITILIAPWQWWFTVMPIWHILTWVSRTAKRTVLFVYDLHSEPRRIQSKCPCSYAICFANCAHLIKCGWSLCFNNPYDTFFVNRPIIYPAMRSNIVDLRISYHSKMLWMRSAWKEVITNQEKSLLR